MIDWHSRKDFYSILSIIHSVPSGSGDYFFVGNSKELLNSFIVSLQLVILPIYCEIQITSIFLV